jgi:protein tyrosine phosphatase
VKDFNAPEHAPAMLKFVKRINEAWSGSSPILVHCSAGVGRSGTLIAIDSLTQVLPTKIIPVVPGTWSGSSPILVHCIAGVGRSGTLIAIDSLTQVFPTKIIVAVPGS